LRGGPSWARVVSNHRPLACEAIAWISRKARKLRRHGRSCAIRRRSDVRGCASMYADSGTRNGVVPLRYQCIRGPQARAEPSSSALTERRLPTRPVPAVRERSPCITSGRTHRHDPPCCSGCELGADRGWGRARRVPTEPQAEKRPTSYLALAVRHIEADSDPTDLWQTACNPMWMAMINTTARPIRLPTSPGQRTRASPRG